MAEQNRFLKLLKDLALALLNATLLLALACLLVAYLTVKKVDGITATFASNLIEVQPVRDQLAALNDNLAGLRGDLADIRSASGEAGSEALQAVQARVQRIEGEVAQTREKVRALIDEPEILIDHAIETTAEEVKGIVRTTLNCAAPAEAPQLSTPAADG
ncbi:hypothetical protein PSA7680_01205 [Pseudoruegeria aquimaris]|uniref:Uncharacterized protein n=1 Tax=Pseudoruegeria aquimaris TaxID=393663 RepID=A0A1Y5RXC0_9RHOB|nr:hypothetical protein [Pseudoruegeria aquimaris]SLN27127.1 hypothetical protein PSA7680_01205 [Pseudoruegeria aquimaris]